jgi:hypothetical protein
VFGFGFSRRFGLIGFVVSQDECHRVWSGSSAGGPKYEVFGCSKWSWMDSRTTAGSTIHTLSVRTPGWVIRWVELMVRELL